MTVGRVMIGTSGWSYEHWVGDFYPDDLSPEERLHHYSSRFSTVEVNATFYRLPSEQTVRAWRSAVPDDFTFAVKGSRLITHFHKLTGAEDATAAFLERIGGLGASLGVVLWQLPAGMARDAALLDRFLGSLPVHESRHAVEFRNPAWFTAETFAVLRDHTAACVHVSSDVMPEDLTVTADFVYVRFHGLARYGGAYPETELEHWAAFLAEQSWQGRDCYAYFNNDFEGHAPRDAACLIGMVQAQG